MGKMGINIGKRVFSKKEESLILILFKEKKLSIKEISRRLNCWDYPIRKILELNKILEYNLPEIIYCQDCGRKIKRKNKQASKLKFCKQCAKLRIKERRKIYRKNHKKEISEKNKEYYKIPKVKKNKKIYAKNWWRKNREEQLIKKREYRKENKVKIKSRNKEYRRKNKKKIREYNKRYTIKNKDRLNEIQRVWHKKNYNKLKVSKKIWVEKNREKVREINNYYYRNRLKNDNEFAMKVRLRNYFGKIFRIYTKTGKIMSSKKYGIDYNAIIEYLKPFPTDLENWHIDHIKPLCSFNFVNPDGSTNIKEVQKAFAPENHQWLLAEDNLSKGKKVEKQIKLVIP